MTAAITSGDIFLSVLSGDVDKQGSDIDLRDLQAL